MSNMEHDGGQRSEFEDFMSMDDQHVYREPNSLHISDDWDTLMEDFLDDFEDYTDVDFPKPDDDF